MATSQAAALEQKILSTWFQGHFSSPTLGSQLSSLLPLWFGSSKETDQKLEKEFKNDILGHQSLIHEMRQTPSSVLSMIILLDQFPRNIFRNTPAAFQYDRVALELAKEAIEKKFDQKIHPVARTFMYLPFEHSEELEMQNISVEKFNELANELKQENEKLATSLLKYATEHYEIIQRFKRFPYRNQVLNRLNTKEEEEYLANIGGQLYGVGKK